MAVFEQIKARSQEFFRLSHHDWFHVERVYNLAVRLAKEEKADLDVVKASVLLHDVARALEDEGKIEDHAVESARIASKILKEVNFPEEKTGKIIEAIEAHRFMKGMKPKSLEAKILQDADRLDMLGAIGLARGFTRGGWSNQPIYDPSIPPKKVYDGRSQTSINHIYEKILKIKDTLNTKTAKQIAEERHRFVELFVDRLLKEWNGQM